jgi:hypothetical protein
VTLHIDVKHSAAEASYSIVTDRDGRKYLQIDTYGSGVRKLKGKKSQSIRLTPEAISQLKEIIVNHFSNA